MFEIPAQCKNMRSRTLLRFGLIPILLVLISTPLLWSSTTTSSTFSAHFIDVGQGDSILLRDDTGFDILIDGGKSSAGPTVVAYIRNLAVDDVDVMIASHADADHIGGLIDVLEAGDIPVQAVLYNGYAGTTQTWLDFQTAVTNAGLALSPIQFPAEYTWGSMDVYVFNPPSGLTDPDQNDASVVLRIAFTDIDFMLTGDIDSTIEANVIARGTPIASEILKVPHHGSSYSSSTDFLTAVNPEVAVIQVGTNPYGHPAQDTLARLISAGVDLFRTDLDGTIVIQSDGVSYEVIPSIYRLYLPLVLKDAGAPPPTDTPEPPEPDVQITFIFYDGLEPTYEGDEYAEITNVGVVDVDLASWRLNAGDPGQDFYFPSYVIGQGESCRVYTDEYHPESCGFNFERGSAIWSNGGDCGYLYDDDGTLVSTYCY